jgi:hypothetical protein
MARLAIGAQDFFRAGDVRGERAVPGEHAYRSASVDPVADGNGRGSLIGALGRALRP